MSDVRRAAGGAATNGPPGREGAPLRLTGHHLRGLHRDRIRPLASLADFGDGMTPTQEWFSGFPQVARQLLAFAPVIASAALLLLTGWLLGRLARYLTSRAVGAVLTRLGARPSLRGAIVSSGVAGPAPGGGGGVLS